jgi:hypothetical protein
VGNYIADEFSDEPGSLFHALNFRPPLRSMTRAEDFRKLPFEVSIASLSPRLMRAKSGRRTENGAFFNRSDLAEKFAEDSPRNGLEDPKAEECGDLREVVWVMPRRMCDDWAASDHVNSTVSIDDYSSSMARSAFMPGDHGIQYPSGAKSLSFPQQIILF